MCTSHCHNELYRVESTVCTVCIVCIKGKTIQQSGDKANVNQNLAKFANRLLSLQYDVTYNNMPKYTYMSIVHVLV